jgi:hypothetical protein
VPNFKAAWYGLADPVTQEIRTVGALVLGADRVLLRLFPEYAARESEFNLLSANLLETNGGWDAALLFEHYVDSANGYSVDISVPFDVAGESIEYVASALVTQLQERAAYTPGKLL